MASRTYSGLAAHEHLPTGELSNLRDGRETSRRSTGFCIHFWKNPPAEFAALQGNRSDRQPGQRQAIHNRAEVHAECVSVSGKSLPVLLDAWSVADSLTDASRRCGGPRMRRDWWFEISLIWLFLLVVFFVAVIFR